MFDELTLAQDHIDDGLIEKARIQEDTAVVRLAMRITVVALIAPAACDARGGHPQRHLVPGAPEQPSSDDGTAQHGQHAVGAVAVSWSRTDACSTVTSVRRTVLVGESKAVMSVRSS